ncbi:MAG: Verru_Chthon cassette protein C [Akkermansiaceae bacterium]|nr:Verru_Chthon cassette protein C [Akkermansiaceae bacterium]
MPEPIQTAAARGPERSRRRPATRGAPRGFTLTEMLVSMAVLALILVLTTNMVSGTQKTLRTARSSAAQFREARRAFETVTRTIGQATLNTYWDYDDPQTPTQYLRQSELHFVTGPAEDLLDSEDTYTHGIFFVAPFGFAGSDATGENIGTDPYRNLESLLNAWGYYIKFNDTDDDAPPFIRDLQQGNPPVVSVKKGFRLMEYRQPSEELTIYKDKLREKDNDGRSSFYQWFREELEENSRVVADNIIALVVRPVVSEQDARKSSRDPWWIAPEYTYDSRQFQWGGRNDLSLTSRNQVPPVLELTLVAVDESSYIAYERRNPSSDPRTVISDLLENRFKEAEKLTEDLDSLELGLSDLGISHRVFSASVGLRTAKWSE